MKKYLQSPSLRAWQVYYEYKENNTTYQEIANRYGCTRERIRQLVNKVLRYLMNDNVNIMTKEQVLEEIKKSDSLLDSIKFYHEV